MKSQVTVVHLKSVIQLQCKDHQLLN